jgi:hypothetical protein
MSERSATTNATNHVISVTGEQQQILTILRSRIKDLRWKEKCLNAKAPIPGTQPAIPIECEFKGWSWDKIATDKARPSWYKPYWQTIKGKRHSRMNSRMMRCMIVYTFAISRGWL